MDMPQIRQAMDRNRQAYEQQIASIRLDTQLTGPAQRKQLAEAWLEAMRAHYRLLWAYLQARDVTPAEDRLSPKPLTADQLRAPRRPEELPESLSRYVITAHHAGQLI